MDNSKSQLPQIQKVIGLLPASGQATRIAPLPCSKELYPLGWRPAGEGQGLRPKVVCHYLLERMQLAGISEVYIILRAGKWDIPTYLGDGAMLDMHLAYLMMNLPFGAPYTLDQAFPFVQEALVALGFPDVIFQPDDAFARLLARQAETKADVVLGLFPTDQPQKGDMVDLDESGRVRRIDVKPVQTHLRYGWTIAVWTPVFTQFMHEYLLELQEGNGPGEPGHNLSGQRELFVGDVIQAAICAGLQVDSVLFPDGGYLDIGTPENLVQAAHNIAAWSAQSA